MQSRKSYWMNTSGNDVINHFIDSINDPGMLTKGELERLVNGEFITQKVDEMITYKELYSSIDNLWSTLFDDRLSDAARLYRKWVLPPCSSQSSRLQYYH